MLPALVGGLFLYAGYKALTKKPKTETVEPVEQNTPTDSETPTLILTKPKVQIKSNQNLTLQRRSLLIFCYAKPQTIPELLKYCRVAIGLEALRDEAGLVFALSDLLAEKLLEYHNGFYTITPQGQRYINTR